jgi:DNA mismatch endonuclease (patch repair protein)
MGSIFSYEALAKANRVNRGINLSDVAGNDPRQEAWAKGAYPRPMSEGRSRNMKANRRVDTKPEVALRSALHRLGYRYRKDFRIDLAAGVRVRPDIVFTARKVAVFVDGCFWHVCPEHGRQPTSNEWYWTPKLRRNVERDRAADAALTAAGWRVIRLWEHEPLAAAVEAVLEAVGSRDMKHRCEASARR